MKPFDEIDRALEEIDVRSDGARLVVDDRPTTGDARSLYREMLAIRDKARAARALLAGAVKGAEVWFVRGEENEPPNGRVYRLVKEMPRRHDDEVRYRLLVIPLPETREVERG